MSSENKILYQDSLITIEGDYLTLKNYYFPSMSSKKILFANVENIKVYDPSILRGKWRIQGTGDFRIWYPADSSRYKRDKIFVIIYKNKWMRSAFTVEDLDKVEEIFKVKGLVKQFR